MNPLMATVANRLLQMKLRQFLRLDPFWQDKLAELNGVRLKLILTDIGFKRVFQFGPTDLHLAPPFTTADYTLTTRSIHLLKLRDAVALAQAFDEGHCHLQGDQTGFDELMQVLRCWQLDWEGLLAQALPDAMAHQVVRVAETAQKGAIQLGKSFGDSYRFWRDNEVH